VVNLNDRQIGRPTKPHPRTKHDVDQMTHR